MDHFPKEYYEWRERQSQRFYERLLELALHERKNMDIKGNILTSKKLK